MKFLFLFIAISFCSAAKVLCQEDFQPTWESIDRRPVPAWFTEAKFGIFIHWGVYSVPAWAPTGDSIPVYSKYAEWYWYRKNENSVAGQLFRNHHNKVYGENFQYQDFVRDFKAENFVPGDWADILAASGAKYIVLTSKHHEGFTLWPSAQSWNWNSLDVGPHKDLAGALSKAVKAKGLHMGFYYSLYEWYNPLYHSNLQQYIDDHMAPQMKDLVTRYEPDILWTDGEWEHTSSDWKAPEFLAWLYNESPVKNKIVVNDRWGSDTRGKHGGIYTTEYDLVFNDNAKTKTITHPWEECRGIGGSFGYNRAEQLKDYTSSQELIHILIQKVARGGNLLLDIGPTADGRIPVIMQQRLKDIGNWLQMNGEAVYETNVWKDAPAITNETTLFFTRKGKDLYAIATRFPDKAITVTNIKAPGNISLLGYSGKLKTGFKNNRLTIQPPAFTSSDNASTGAWVFKIENALN